MPNSLVDSAADIGFSCRELTAYAEFRDAAELYTRVFDYTDRDYSLNPNLLSALGRNGGSAVGAFDPDDVLIGFAYGFAGRDAQGAEFHYSQAAVVDPTFQGRGVGHALKSAQREVARRWGQRAMRWTFDPLLARNAHFNLSSLGAVGIAFEPDFYDRPDTDRLVVVWDLEDRADPYADLRTAAPPALRRADWGAAVSAPAVGRMVGTGPVRHWIAIPADAEALTPDERARVRSALGSTLSAMLHDGFVLIAATRVDAETTAYLAVPEDHRREGKP